MTPPADLDEARIALCKALAIPYTSTWEYALADARSAGIVRDAEYRAADRIEAANKRARAFCLDNQVPAVHGTYQGGYQAARRDMLAALDGRET